MNDLPRWLIPPAPELQGEPRDVILFGALAIEEDEPDEPPAEGMTKKGVPLRRARNGELPLIGTEMRIVFDAVPIWPQSATATEIGEITYRDARRACSCLALLADRKVPLVRRVRKGKVLRWTRDR